MNLECTQIKSTINHDGGWGRHTLDSALPIMPNVKDTEFPEVYLLCLSVFSSHTRILLDCGDVQIPKLKKPQLST